jgi:hypothetical protein
MHHYYTSQDWFNLASEKPYEFLNNVESISENSFSELCNFRDEDNNTFLHKLFHYFDLQSEKLLFVLNKIDPPTFNKLLAVKNRGGNNVSHIVAQHQARKEHVIKHKKRG